MSGLTQRQMDQRVERRVKRLLNKQMRELSDMLGSPEPAIGEGAYEDKEAAR